MGNVRMRAEQINYGASNVKAALDDLDPMGLIALSGRMDTIEAWKATVKTEEKTGAEVTFTNALALAAVSLSAEIEASQDLHGLPFPYVGGAYKNKIGLTVTAASTIANVSCEAKADNEVIMSGTTNGQCDYNIRLLNNVTFTKDTTVTFSFTGSYSVNPGVMTVYLAKATSGYINLGNLNSAGKVSYTFTADEEVKGIMFRAWDVSMVLDIDAKAQLEIGSTATSYAPYSNICPISGRTAVTITDYDSESNTATVTVQLGQTVYGGSLNLTTGAMTVTDKIIDLGSVNWTLNTPNHQFYCDIISDMKNTSNFFTDGIISSCYKIDARTYADYNDAHCRGINGQRIYIVDTRTTDNDTFKTLVTGQTVLYPLAESVTIQLTPEQLTMLKGYNRLSADTGDITVEAYTGAAWGGDEA